MRTPERDPGGPEHLGSHQRLLLRLLLGSSRVLRLLRLLRAWVLLLAQQLRDCAQPQVKQGRQPCVRWPRTHLLLVALRGGVVALSLRRCRRGEKQEDGTHGVASRYDLL